MSIVRVHCPECQAYPELEADQVSVILWPDRQSYAFRCPCGARVSNPCSPEIVDLLTIHAGCQPVRLALPVESHAGPPLTPDLLLDFHEALENPSWFDELVTTPILSEDPNPDS